MKQYITLAIMIIITSSCSINSFFNKNNNKEIDLDIIDHSFFQSIQDIANTLNQNSSWNEILNESQFNIHDIPIYAIRIDENRNPIKAYLINQQFSDLSLEEIDHNYSGFQIFRYDEHMNILNENLSRSETAFEISLNLNDSPVFAIAYNESLLDITPLTNVSNNYSRHDSYFNTFIHELFHHYQYRNDNWISYPWGGEGLLLSDYPVTRESVALRRLEIQLLLATRNMTSIIDKEHALKQLLSIRKVRILNEQTIKCNVQQLLMTHGKQATDIVRVGQPFTACSSGDVFTISINVHHFDFEQAILNIQTGINNWNPEFEQIINLNTGENTITLNRPFTVNANEQYMFTITAKQGNISLMGASKDDTHPNSESYFIRDGRFIESSPESNLWFDIAIEDYNHINRMDRYQEQVEGSATFITDLYFKQSQNTSMTTENNDALERLLFVTTTRRSLFNFMFRGGWYHTGSEIMILIDEIIEGDWKSSIAKGGSPIEILSSHFEPLSFEDHMILLQEAKTQYNWEEIQQIVNALPNEFFD